MVLLPYPFSLLARRSVNDRDWEIYLLCRLGYTEKRVARQFGLSPCRVNQIVARLARRFSRHSQMDFNYVKKTL